MSCSNPNHKEMDDCSPHVSSNLPKYGRCRLISQTHPEQDTRQGEDSVRTHKQQTFHVSITLAGLTAINSETDPSTWW